MSHSPDMNTELVLLKRQIDWLVEQLAVAKHRNSELMERLDALCVSNDHLDRLEALLVEESSLGKAAVEAARRLTPASPPSDWVAAAEAVAAWDTAHGGEF